VTNLHFVPFIFTISGDSSFEPRSRLNSSSSMRCPCGYSWLVRLVGHVDEVGIAPWMTGLVLYLRYCVSPNFDASDCSGCYLSALSLLSICSWLFILHVPGLVGNFRSCVWSTSRYLADSLSLSSHFLTICPTCSDRCRLHCLCNVLNVVVPESACDFLGIFALLLLSHCLSHVYASLSRSLVVVVISSRPRFSHLQFVRLYFPVRLWFNSH